MYEASAAAGIVANVCLGLRNDEYVKCIKEDLKPSTLPFTVHTLAHLTCSAGFNTFQFVSSARRGCDIVKIKSRRLL
jgi:hypothetical protein